MKEVKQDCTFPQDQQKVRLNKQWFSYDLFWSIQDGDLIDIDTVIAIYLTREDTYNARQLVKLFGKERVYKIMEMIEEEHPTSVETNKRIIEDENYPVITSSDFAPLKI